jgi:Domain of unknown function (DUF4411)
VLVFDTSAFLNGWHDHYPPATFPSVWDVIGDAMAAGRIVTPREVYREITKLDDDVCAWAKMRAGHITDPIADVQRQAGTIVGMFPNPGVRNRADPFVVAEAQVRGLTVVTYEGRSFSGVPTRNWARTIPGICGRLGVACRTLPEALAMLGATF